MNNQYTLRPFILLTAMCLLMVLSACQTNRKFSPRAHSGSIPPGSYLELHQPLTIAAGDDQVFIQESKTVSSGGYSYGFDQYYPFCYMQVADISKQPQIIEPGRFEITRVNQDETEFVQRYPVKVASSAGVTLGHGDVRMLAGGGGDGGGVRLIVVTTVMALTSEQQPAVKRLVCGGGFDLETFADLPTVDQVDAVLGSIATLVRNVDKTKP